MTSLVLSDFTPDRPAAQVDAALRQALAACDWARECAVLWFAEVQRRRLYRDLGHPSLEVYATCDLGFSRNRYWQFKRLADDLDRLPALKDAVAAGDLGWTKAQQVARVATPDTQDQWVATAAATGRRALEQAVRQARQLRRRNAVRPDASGQLSQPAQPDQRAQPSQPDQPVQPLQPCRPGAATVPAIGGTAAIPELPLALALAPATPAALPPSTITLRADALQLARFEALLERAHKLGLVPAGADRLDTVLAGLEALVTAAPAAATTGPSVQVVVHQCPDCGEAAAVTRRGELPLAPAQVEALACDAHIQRPGQANRATIPPKTRATVLARDRHRCTTPGCGATRFLEVHHVTPRARGGTNRPENLVTLCGRCHRFAHELAPAQVGEKMRLGDVEVGGEAFSAGKACRRSRRRRRRCGR